jgi:hypothetical protein
VVKTVLRPTIFRDRPAMTSAGIPEIFPGPLRGLWHAVAVSEQVFLEPVPSRGVSIEEVSVVVAGDYEFVGEGHHDRNVGSGDDR